MIESMLFNRENYRKYGYTSITKTLNNPDHRFKLVDSVDVLDMNRYTVVTFSNGDSYRTKNYVLYNHVNEPSTFFNPTTQGNYLQVDHETTAYGAGPGIEAYYHGAYEDDDHVMHETPITVDWVKIEINVD